MTAGKWEGRRGMVTVRIAEPRDALTGEPLRPNTARLRVSSERLDVRQTPEAREDGFLDETTPCPIRLHTPQMETADGNAVGKVFARQFAQYLIVVRPVAVERAEWERSHWWANAYWRLRVRAQFIERFGLEHGQVRYHVAVSLKSGYRNLATLRAETRRTLFWLRTQVDIAEKFAVAALVRVVRPIERRV